MHAVLKGWLGFFALGAGLIHLALVIGSPLAIGMPLLLIGLAEFTWGVFALTAVALPLPRVARIGAVVPLLFWVVALLLAAGAALPAVRVLPMLVASLFDLAIAVTITALLRRHGSADPAPVRPGRYLIALGAGALVVVALTAPALAATEARDLVVPHDLDLPAHGH